jgi:PKD repeat protein
MRTLRRIRERRGLPRWRGGARLQAGIGGLFAIAAVVSLAALGGVGQSVSPAQAQYGSNDSFDGATAISSLPFGDVVDTTGASTEPGEPQFCIFMSQTLWYRYTPQTQEVLRADSNGTGPQTNINVYQAFGPGIGNLSFIGCAQNGSPVQFTGQAGVSYYIQAGILFGATGDLHVNLQRVAGPANDDFGDAASIGSLPYDASVDTTAATLEAGEPSPSCVGGLAGSAWYAFTPAASGSVSASINSSFSTGMAAYTGNSVSGLTQVGCHAFGGVMTIHVDAGTTYYFQVGGMFGQRGSLSFHLDVTPPPQANFFQSVSDPSSYDNIQFFDQSSDPGEMPIQSQAWSFGDGGTATGCCPLHRYTADGDYTVELTVTTTDGRTGSIRRVIRVRTHDVGIAKIAAPQNGSVGQTRQIQVNVFDLRYPETVQVQLLKSVPGGFEVVGTLTQSISPRGKNQTTPYTFNYTFTADDASVGKVTFKAVATIVGARDALPADNEAIAAPTRVSR